MSKRSFVINDEPATIDLLGREVYARALQRIAKNCQTPLVMSVNGDWGSGKTSLMRITQKLLEANGIKTVWFNPWMYQSDESPIIPLLHEIKKQAIAYKIKIEGLKLLTILTSIVGEAFLRNATGGSVNTEFILKQGKEFEGKYFEVKTITMRIQEHFQKVVNAIAGSEGRLVIFIDDLDRCLPPQTLKILEDIKLFLSAEKCVYIVGMDREIVEQAVESRYGELRLSGVSYVDKIIQLPFRLPPITDEGVDNYLKQLKVDIEMGPYYSLIRKGTGHNPRAIKRFVNAFLFNHALAQEIRLENYQPCILVKLLILQLRYPSFYGYISRHKKEFSSIEKWANSTSSEAGNIKLSTPLQKFMEKADEEFAEILQEKPLIEEQDITQYIHLTTILGSTSSSSYGLQGTVVNIIYPANGVTVNRIENVTGELYNLPIDHVVWIAVYIPRVGRYYPMSCSVDLTNDGIKWSTTAFFGGRDDTGLEFQVFALALNQNAQNRVEKYVSECERNSSYPGLKSLPDGAVVLNRVTVIRGPM